MYSCTLMYKPERETWQSSILFALHYLRVSLFNFILLFRPNEYFYSFCLNKWSSFQIINESVSSDCMKPGRQRRLGLDWPREWWRVCSDGYHGRYVLCSCHRSHQPSPCWIHVFPVSTRAVHNRKYSTYNH